MKQQTILILGAGVGGLHCARRLAAEIGHWEDVRIVLVDREPYHMLHSTLYHAVAADLRRSEYCLPIKTVLQGYRVEFLQDLVTKIDPVNQKVTLHETGKLNYDYLVVALGSQPNDYDIPGLADHAHYFASFSHALRLRKTLMDRLARQKKVRVVIGGGGLAGCELAGMLSHMSKRGRIQLSLVEQAPTLLSCLPPRAGERAASVLGREKVQLILGQAIKRVESKIITLKNGRKLPYEVFIWTGGVKPSVLIQKAGFHLDKCGRVSVRSTLQARGYARVYVIGDAASFVDGNKQVLPGTTPHALREGLHAARNIIRQLTHRTPRSFRPTTASTIVTLGGEAGFISLGNMVFGGRWVVKVRSLAEWWYASGLMPAKLFRTERNSRARVKSIQRIANRPKA